MKQSSYCNFASVLAITPIAGKRLTEKSTRIFCITASPIAHLEDMKPSLKGVNMFLTFHCLMFIARLVLIYPRYDLVTTYNHRLSVYLFRLSRLSDETFTSKHSVTNKAASSIAIKI